jgi:crotonobetainyl-CoA:carnitine CoA-transferase CaiB-like acyl-CoA transferase
MDEILAQEKALVRQYPTPQDTSCQYKWNPLRMPYQTFGHSADSSQGKPLKGLLVVSLEQALAAPLASCRLADAGARVIKVERQEGDFARGYDRAASGMSSYFAWTNRGKESVTLDYKTAPDAALLHSMLAKADVFIQNIAPGALERAGFDSVSLRARYPRLITCDISGYGQGHAASHLKAYDLLVQCESGLVSVSGSPDGLGRIGVSICDIGAGMNATTGILMALLQRQRTGKGSGIRVSLFDGAADWMTVPYVHERYGAGAAGPVGLRHPSIAPYGAFHSQDGKTLLISIQNDREWAQFCQICLQTPALATDPRFATNDQRVRHREALDGLIAAHFLKMDLLDIVQTLHHAQTAYGQVRSVGDLLQHPALRTWPMPVNDAELQMVAPPVQTEWDDARFAPAPVLGQHNLALRQEFAAQA